MDDKAWDRTKLNRAGTVPLRSESWQHISVYAHKL